jgi:hypothetical protein
VTEILNCFNRHVIMKGRRLFLSIVNKFLVANKVNEFLVANKANTRLFKTVRVEMGGSRLTVVGFPQKAESR